MYYSALLYPSFLISHFGIRSETARVSICHFLCPLFVVCLAFFFLSVLAESMNCMSRIIWVIKYIIVSYHLLVSFNKTEFFLQVGEPLYYFQEAGIRFRWTLIKITNLSFHITSIEWKDGDWFPPPPPKSFSLLFHLMKNVMKYVMKGNMDGRILTPVCDSMKSLMKMEDSLIIFSQFVFNKNGFFSVA